MKKVLRIVSTMAIVALFLTAILPAGAAPAVPAARGTLFYDGQIVSTVVTPGQLPNGGNDPFFRVTNGFEGQLGIAGVAPGDPGYNGGAWAVHDVTWIKRPPAGTLLKSKADVIRAKNAGFVTVTRNKEADFRCPINPGKPLDNGNNGNNGNNTH